MKVLGLLVLGAGAYMILGRHRCAASERAGAVAGALRERTERVPADVGGRRARDGRREVRRRRGQEGAEPVRAEGRRPGRRPLRDRGGLLSASGRRRPGQGIGRPGGSTPGVDHARLPRAARAARTPDGGRGLPARTQRRERPRLADPGQERLLGVRGWEAPSKRSSRGRADDPNHGDPRDARRRRGGDAPSRSSSGASRAVNEVRHEATAPRLQARGDAAAAMGDMTRAEQYFVAALAAGGDPRVLTRRLLVVCVADERYPAAASYGEDYLRTPPRGHRGPLRGRDGLHRPRRQSSTRATNSHECSSSAPDLADAHYALATVLRAAGRLDRRRRPAVPRVHPPSAPRDRTPRRPRASLLKSVP